MEIDNKKDYFYLTMHFMQKPKDFQLISIDNGKFIHEKTREIYYKSNSFDFGMGSEHSYILDRKYSFDDLISIVMYDWDKQREHNIFGAIAFIMEGTTRQSDFVKEFIEFLEQHIKRKNSTILKRMEYVKYFFIPFICDKWEEDSYYLIKLRSFPEWRKIENQIHNSLNCTT